MLQTSSELILALNKLADSNRAEAVSKYFKSEKAGEPLKDKFIGVSMPQVREVAAGFKYLELGEIARLLHNEVHEVRMAGLVILDGRMRQALRKNDEITKKEIYDFYLAHTAGINNWDLVDISARDIIGGYIYGKSDKSILDNLAESPNLWEQRMAVIATMYFNDRREYDDLYRICEKLLFHPHHYIQKAVGWLLRESGKQDQDRLEEFLEKYAATMPRITLRYCLEKFNPDKKLYFMKKKK